MNNVKQTGMMETTLVLSCKYTVDVIIADSLHTNQQLLY